MKPLVDLLFETLPAQSTFLYPCIYGFWLHKKFDITKCVLCTSVCASKVAFLVFTFINSPFQLHNSNLALWWSCKSNSPLCVYT
jgi:hypothetical protein